MNDTLGSMSYTSRRRFLAAAASTYLGVGIAAGPGASLLRAQASEDGRRLTPGRAKHVIYIYLGGGMSHIDTFDPKFGKTKGEFDAITTSAAGVLVTDQLPRMAQQMHHVAAINSMTSTQGAHERGNYLMHTSYAPLGTIRHASMGAWVLKWAGRLNKTLPGHVLVNGGGDRHPGAGFLGSAYEPLRIGRPDAGLQNIEHHRGVSDDQFTKRRDLMRKLDAPFRASFSHDKVQAYNRFYDEAVRLMHSEDVKGFDLGAESSETRAAYGENPLGQGCLLARRLVENGVRFIEVQSGGWDTHQENFERLSERQLPPLDQALSALIADLNQRGLLDETLVVLTTEFGRTPRINDRTGRDHYPRVFSALLAGGGVQGGRAYGKSDSDGAAVADQPVTPQDFNATIAYAMGIDWEKDTVSAIGRPFNMADKGEPVTALF